MMPHLLVHTHDHQRQLLGSAGSASLSRASFAIVSMPKAPISNLTRVLAAGHRGLHYPPHLAPPSTPIDTAGLQDLKQNEVGAQVERGLSKQAAME
jgi:hypothetical protein